MLFDYSHTKTIALFLTSVFLLSACASDDKEPVNPLDKIVFKHEGMQRCYEGWRNELNWQTLDDVTYLSCGKNSIYTVEGIEQLPELRYFSISFTAITALDLSHNTKLTELNIIGNLGLFELDLSNNTELEDITINHNALRSLDISNLPKLTNANLMLNNLEQVEVYNSPNIQILWFSYNKLTQLDVFEITNLQWLSVYNNQLDLLDVSYNLKLKDLDITYNNFTTIDINANTELTTLRLAGNKLTAIDLDNNVYLQVVDARDNPWSGEMINYLLGLDRITTICLTNTTPSIAICGG